MQTVLIVIHLMVVAALVVVVLLQRSEGGALGIGGGGGGGFFTGRGQANALTRATAILATIFFLTSIALTVLASMNHQQKSIFDGSKPGQTPPDRTNMSTGSSAGSPGQFSGVKALEWGQPKAPPKLSLPKPAPPGPNEHTLAPEPGPKK